MEILPLDDVSYLTPESGPFLPLLYGLQLQVGRRFVECKAENVGQILQNVYIGMLRDTNLVAIDFNNNKILKMCVTE